MRKAIPALMISFFLLVIPVVVYAAQHDTTTDSLGLAKDWKPDPSFTLSQACEACHGDNPMERASASIHNPNISYTDVQVRALGRCQICHDTHDSQQGQCLPERTISDFCFLCHDGTAANVDGDVDSDGGTALGYYRANNVIYGLPTASTPGARHRVNANAVNSNDYGETNATSVIPLGETLYSWDGQPNEKLKCTSCHSAHGYQVVAPFFSKSPYPTATVPTSNVFYGWEAAFLGETNMYLRKKVGTNTVDYYGSRWCAGCHIDAMGGVIPGTIDHPIDTNTSYNWLTWDAPGPATSPIWRTYNSDLMAWLFGHSWQATSGAPDPLCMNCHDDPIDVDDIGVGTTEDTTAFPYRSSFPHESFNVDFRVETADDLCLNCHLTSSLP